MTSPTPKTNYCYGCGSKLIQRGPAAGMCPTCDDTDKEERDAHQADYEDRCEELREDYWGPR